MTVYDGRVTRVGQTSVPSGQFTLEERLAADWYARRPPAEQGILIQSRYGGTLRRLRIVLGLTVIAGVLVAAGLLSVLTGIWEPGPSDWAVIEGLGLLALMVVGAFLTLGWVSDWFRRNRMVDVPWTLDVSEHGLTRAGQACEDGTTADVDGL